MPLSILRGPRDVPSAGLKDRRVAVIGYGNQGHAHGLNLRDSGVDVVIGQPEGSAGWDRAVRDGFTPQPTPEAASGADLVIVALPDEKQAAIFRDQIGPALDRGATLGFLHGFALRFGLVDPDDGIGVVMVAPKGPGKTLRDRYVAGQGIPALMDIHKESTDANAETMALAWAAGIGCGRAGVIRASTAAETETDLFGEQAVLCGGMAGLILTAFEILVERGYPPELAYLECCHEVKQVADLLYAGGLSGMMDAISNTAEVGAHVAIAALIDAGVRERMERLLDDVRDGSFAKRLMDDHEAGAPWITARRRELAAHPIEAAGAVIRGLMPWVSPSEATQADGKAPSSC